MKNNKDDTYYQGKIISDLEFIIKHTSNKSIEEIGGNDLLIDSILFRIIQISENNNHLSDDFKSEHKEISWSSIKGMRNRIVHDYGYVDMSIVYNAVTVFIPEMYEILKKIK